MPSDSRDPLPVPVASSDGAESRPGVLRALCLVVLVQAAVLLGLGGGWLRDLATGASDLPGATVFLAAFVVGIAALLVGCSRALWRGRRWARSPVITWQLLLVAMSVGWIGAEPSGWALAVLLSAMGVGAGLLLPAVVVATSGRPPRPNDPTLT